MADDVIVTFGAKIDELISAVNEVKNKIGEISSAAKETSESFESMGAIILEAFAVEKIASFVERMAEMGEQIERTGAMLGTSAKTTQEMGFAARLAGGSAESMALSLERMQVNLQRAQDGMSPAAKALQSLGLSAKDLIGLSVDQQMNKIADAASHFADGGTKTADLMMLMGRGAAQMVPLLDEGSAGLDRMRQAAINAGAIMSEQTVGVLANMEKNLVTVKAAFTSLGATIVSVFARSINDGTNAMIDMISGFNALLQAGSLWDAAMEDIRFAAESLFHTLLQLGVIAKDVFTMNWSAISDDWERGNKLVEDDVKSHLEKLRAIMEPARAIMAGNEGRVGAESGLPQAPPAAFENTSAIKSASEAAQAQIKQAELSYQTKIQLLQAELKMHQITQAQETAETIKAIGQRSLAEINALTEAQAGMAKGSSEWKKLEDEKTAITLKAVKDRQATELKAMEETSKQWQAVGSSIASAFNSQTKALLSGTESFATAMKNIFADLVVALINELEKLIVKEAIAEGLKIAIEGPAALIPGFAEGTSYVPQTGLALLHQGEAVIPASQNIGGITGSNITINASQLDTSGMRAMLMQLVPQISQMVANHQSQQFSTYGAH